MDPSQGLFEICSGGGGGAETTSLARNRVRRLCRSDGVALSRVAQKRRGTAERRPSGEPGGHAAVKSYTSAWLQLPAKFAG